jgi:cytochrome c oxidase subunit I+III
MGMPRRVYTYADGLGLNLLNALSTVGAFMFAAGVVLCFADAWRILRKSEQPHGNPWNAPTLEWLPAEDYGVRSIPQIASTEPLWDRPGLPQEVEDGRHWLPGTAFGGRETLVTSPRKAELRHLLRLPGDGWLPFIAAAGTAGFFLLLTVAWIVPAFVFGTISIAAIVAWLWGSDQPPPQATVKVGDGLTLPVGAIGRQSHSWWAMLILLAVDASIFVALAFSHLHVSMALEICPPPGAALPESWRAIAASVLLAAGSALMVGSVRLLGTRTRQVWLQLAVVVAMACTAAAFAIDFSGQVQAGLAPRAQAWAATVAALLAWQGLHVGVVLLMGGYVLARSLRGRLRVDARATLDNSALMWHYVTAQGLAALWLVRLLPQWMG